VPRVPAGGIADGLSKKEGLRYRVLAERLAKDRRVHRLVEEDTGGGLGDEAGPRQRPPKKNGQSPRDRARELCTRSVKLSNSRWNQRVGGCPPPTAPPAEVAAFVRVWIAE
jgi:hypothetical protein